MRKLRDPNGENRQDVWPQTLLAMETGSKYYYLTTLGCVRAANTLLGAPDNEGGPYPNTQKVLVTGRNHQTSTNHFQWTLV